jgi:rod shape determining protein RodA
VNPLLDDPTGLLARIRHSLDWVVLTLTFAVVTLAIINLNSVGEGDWTGRVATQLRWLGIGTVVMLIVTFIDYRVMYRAAYAAYAFGVTLLLLVPLYGITVNNAKRWLGTIDYRIQPSELMKVIMIVALARYLHDTPKDQTRLKRLAVPFLMVLVPGTLVIRQPDLGTGIIILIIAFSLVAATGLRIRAILAVLSAGVLSLVLGWRYMADYQRKRIDVWLDPELYADNEAYQTIQAMISVGNGGLPISSSAAPTW